MTISNLIKCLMAVMCYGWMKVARKSDYGVVLYYHGVTSQNTHVFKDQMAYLSKTYKVVSPTTIASISKGNELETIRPVAITFDDAFENVLINAVPILQQYDLPAAICVPTSHIGKHAAWEMDSDCMDSNESIMSREQIEDLHGRGFEIYSHTSSHCPLAILDEESIKYELQESKKVLEEIVGHDVLSISFPHGSTNASVFKAAKVAGYRFGFTIEPSLVKATSDPLQYGRVSIFMSEPMFVFRLKAAGAYQIEVWLRHLKRAVTRFISSKRHPNKSKRKHHV